MECVCNCKVDCDSPVDTCPIYYQIHVKFMNGDEFRSSLIHRKDEKGNEFNTLESAVNFLDNELSDYKSQNTLLKFNSTDIYFSIEGYLKEPFLVREYS